MKKIKVSSEGMYILAILILSFAVAMITASNFGVSMIVAPAYILSLKLKCLTFGQCEYIIQGLLFCVFCLLMKEVKGVYFSSFLTGVIYGLCLDGWRTLMPSFNPMVTPAGSMSMSIRLIYFIVGMLMSALSIALFFRTYLYPQVYDFFVKGISMRYKKNREHFKIAFDMSCLAISCIMTLLLFKGFVGVGIGTLIMTLLNGMLISFFGKVIDHFFIFEPTAKKFSRRFDICEE